MYVIMFYIIQCAKICSYFCMIFTYKTLKFILNFDLRFYKNAEQFLAEHKKASEVLEVSDTVESFAKINRKI